MYRNMYTAEQQRTQDGEYRRLMAAIGRREEDYTAFLRFCELAGIAWRPGLYAAWCDAHREVVA